MQKRKCHTLTNGFAGRVNYKKFSCHQTVWTPRESNFSHKDIKKKAPCFAQGTRFKYIFCFYFKFIFQFTSEPASPVTVFLSLHIFQIYCIFGIPVSLKKVF